MQPPFEIHTEASICLTCNSLDELISTLDDLQLTYLTTGPISTGISEAGKAFGEADMIGLGVGLDPTYITIMIKPCDGEYYVSVGDTHAAGMMMLGGFCEPTYVERSSFVPWRSALRAVREFVEFGRRSRMIRWHDWSGSEVSDQQE